MQCVWLGYDDVRCSLPGERHMGLYLCDEHYGYILAQQRWIACRAGEVLGFDAFPGYCYLATLGHGRIKIGYVMTAARLNGRMCELERERGHITPLVVLSGGFVREATLHDSFRHLRVPGESEVFWRRGALSKYIRQVRGSSNNLLVGEWRNWHVRPDLSPARVAGAAAERAYPAGQELVTFDVVLTSVGATG